MKNKLEQVDVLHAGFPCQSFPLQGIEKVLMTLEEDYFEIKRLINEFGKDKPKVLVLENSPNILNGEVTGWT